MRSLPNNPRFTAIHKFGLAAFLGIVLASCDDAVSVPAMAGLHQFDAKAFHDVIMAPVDENTSFTLLQLLGHSPDKPVRIIRNIITSPPSDQTGWPIAVVAAESLSTGDDIPDPDCLWDRGELEGMTRTQQLAYHDAFYECNQGVE